MPLSKTEISKEIGQIDNLGEALEYLSTCAECGNATLLANALYHQDFCDPDNSIKGETISNWFKGNTKPGGHFEMLIVFFEKQGVLTNRRSDPSVRHLRLLLAANERQIARIVDGGIKALVDQLLSKDSAWIAGFEQHGNGWHRTKQAREIDASRALLVQKLADKIDWLDEIDPYANDLARLLRMPHWNNARALELRVDYNDLSKAAIGKISDATARSNLLLMSRFADLLYLDNQTESSDTLYSEIGEITPELADSDAEKILRDKLDYLMFGTDLTPDDVSFLFRTGNKRNDIYNKASAERCKGCRLMRKGRFDEGKVLIDKSRGTLSELSRWDSRSKMLQVYLDTLELLAESRERESDPPALSSRAGELIAQTKSNDPDDKPLLAGLLSIQLNACLQEVGLKAEEGYRNYDSLVIALQIDDLLDASIKSYCLFDLPQLHGNAKAIVSTAKSQGGF